jgi:REP element-mobilizing transposase RayT
MNKYNPTIHHSRSIRLKGYDYSQEGLYFITICCHRRGELHMPFGHIENGEMILNEYGTVAYFEWLKTPELRTNVELGEFIIMPNHMHGIIRVHGRGELHSPDIPNELHSTDIPIELHLPDNRGVCKTPLRSPSQTIGAIIRGYKSSVTKQSNELGFDGKLWQRNYYEHIIRNEQSFQTISEYIMNNPAKWVDDKFYNQ